AFRVRTSLYAFARHSRGIRRSHLRFFHRTGYRLPIYSVISPRNAIIFLEDDCTILQNEMGRRGKLAIDTVRDWSNSATVARQRDARIQELTERIARTIPQDGKAEPFHLVGSYGRCAR